MYSRDGALHFSSLKYIATSPLAYANAVQREKFDSPQMRIGRATHALVLEGKDAEVFEGDRRTKAWKEFSEGRDVSDVLNSAEWDLTRRMRDAVFADGEARKLLEACTVREESLEWTRGGHPCRGRLDARTPCRSALMDLKTARTVNPQQFMRTAFREQYHAQVPWYDVGQGKGLGRWSEQFVLAVENSAPFHVQVFRLSPLLIMQGNDAAEEWLRTFDACVASGGFRRGYREGCIEWDAELVISSDEEEEIEE